MHIVLGLLGTVVTILVLLNRLADAGIDLGGLNPFLWSRRRKWRNQYEGNPIFKIENPLDATAILLVAVAKADGDMTTESKKLILDIFENEFSLAKKDAAGLLISSSHLLGDGNELRTKPQQFLAPSKKSFSQPQIDSALSLLERVSQQNDSAHPNAIELIAQVRSELEMPAGPTGTWG